MIAIAIHGGCGGAPLDDAHGTREREYRASLERILVAGYARLERGDRAVDVVVSVVAMMEDSGLYNAGRGAVSNREGVHELDAAVMDGATLAAGAVACVRGVRNPILLARRVMEDSQHVLIAGVGAEDYARAHGFTVVTDDPGEATRAAERALPAHPADPSDAVVRCTPTTRLGACDHGTVGAVALDRAGNLAAATSTGGVAGKHPGRIGDSPLIGAGTYAQNGRCAVSATGAGEYFIRVVAAHDAGALVHYRRLPLQEALNAVLAQVEALGGSGGLIAVDAHGRVAMAGNTPRMYRASIDGRGARLIATRVEDAPAGNPEGGSAVSR